MICNLSYNLIYHKFYTDPKSIFLSIRAGFDRRLCENQKKDCHGVEAQDFYIKRNEEELHRQDHNLYHHFTESLSKLYSEVLEANLSEQI
jgi:hypothetical protein